MQKKTFIYRFADLVTLKISDGKLKNGDYELSVECQSSLNNESEFVNCCKLSKIYEIKIDVVRNGTLEIVLPIIFVFLIASFALAITVLHNRRVVLKPSKLFGVIEDEFP